MKTTTIGLLAALVLLSACNTVEGAGRDLESAGHSIKKSANDNKDDAARDAAGRDDAGRDAAGRG